MSSISLPKADPVQRRHVERLLGGEHRVSHFTSLLLYLRDRNGGREAVQEVGHFIAHQNERTKGFLTRAARDRFSIVRFKFEYLNKPVVANALHCEFLNFLRATVRLMEPSQFGRGIYARKFVYKAVVAISEKSILLPSGLYTIRNASNGRLLISDEELKVLNFVLPNFITRQAFTGADLFSEFQGALRENALINSSESKKLAVLSPLLQLYALSVMHGSKIVLQDKSTAELNVALDDATQSGKLTLELSIPPVQDGKNISLSSPFYTTNLMAVDYCEPEILDSGTEVSVIFNPKGPHKILESDGRILLSKRTIEVSDRGKLALL